ncbi:MAG: hypothetical protein PHF64_03060 [Methanoregula sp.]|nr:hypothetical protein [Methanoregula sp.]
MTPFPTGGLRGNMITVYYPVTQALNITGIDMDRQTRNKRHYLP